MVPKRYLLDTNVLSDLVKHPGGRIARRLQSVGEATVCTSIVVAAELRYGALKKGSQRLTDQLEAVLSGLEILPLEDPTDQRYGELRVALERAGTPMGANDLFVAAHALTWDLILVTGNVREFQRVPNLRVQDWLAP